MTLEDFKNWLKTQTDIGDGIEIGGINGNKDKYLGVYAAKGGPRQRICIGGKSQTHYQVKRLSILIHWTKSTTKAEKKAQEIHALLFGLTNVMMGKTKVISVDPGVAPIPLGKDSAGVCEFSIEAEILYERTD